MADDALTPPVEQMREDLRGQLLELLLWAWSPPQPRGGALEGISESSSASLQLGVRVIPPEAYKG